MMDANQPVDESSFRPALNLIRRRRKYFFATIAAYLPAMWAINKLSPTYRSFGIGIGVWVVVLFTTALMSAVTRCPRCGNYFHVHGMTLLYLRKCLHCQLHINADKRAARL